MMKIWAAYIVVSVFFVGAVSYPIGPLSIEIFRVCVIWAN
jgi:hypothetical protein